MTHSQPIEKEAERLYNISQYDPVAKGVLQETFTAGANFALNLNRWVKVEDGLPEEGDMVYVLQERRHQYAAQYRDGSFIAVGRIAVEKVTHWTPQLAPPTP
jgi:hypothetical protein